MKRLKIIIASFFVLLIAQTAFAQKIRVETKNGKQYIVHKVQAKETVYAISKLYEVSQEDLVAENPDIAEVLKQGVLVYVPYEEDEQVNTNPEKLQSSQEQITFEKHTVQKGEWLTKIANSYEVSVADLKKWNKLEGEKIVLGQELIVGVASNKSKNKNNVNKNTLANNTKSTNKSENKNILKSESPGQQTIHTVVEKETLYAIGRKYGVAPADIQEWNQLESGAINLGQKLKIYSTVNLTSNNNQNTNTTDPFNQLNNNAINNNQIYAGPFKHIVQFGETLESIRDKYNVSRAEIAYWNNLPEKSALIREGQELKVYMPKKITHYVQRGETMQNISANYKVLPRQIEIWNQMNWGANVSENQALILYLPTGPQPTNTTANNNNNNTANNQNYNPLNNNNYNTNSNTQNQPNYILHTVANNEFLYNIAQRYGVSVEEVKNWNNLSAYYVNPGQTLKIYPKNNTQTVNNNQQLNNQNTYQQPNNQNYNNQNTNTNNLYNSNQNQNKNNTVTQPNNTNPYTGNPYSYNTTSKSNDPFDQLNNSTVTQPNNNQNEIYRGNNQQNNQNYNSTNQNTNTGNPYQNYNNNPYQNTNNQNQAGVNDYANTNTNRFVNGNNTTNNNPYQNNQLNNNTQKNVYDKNNISENGLAELAQNIQSPRPYVALHRTAPVGTLIIVKNPANGTSVVVEVAAPINPAETSGNVVIQVAPVVMQRLGAATNRLLPVELTYMLKTN